MKEKAAQLASNWRTYAVLAVIIAAFIVYRNGSRWWQQLTRRDQGNYRGQDPVQDNSQRQAELAQLAQDAFTSLNSTLMIGGVTATGREWLLEKIAALNDTEFRWVAQRYASISNGQTLRGDLDDEWMPFTDVDERLIARLNQLAL